MITRPFNLSQALAGAPVVTRAGLSVKVITALNEGDYPDLGRGHRLIAIVEGADAPRHYSLNGNYIHGEVSHSDLFMPALCEVQGKPVFIGDEVCSGQHLGTWKVANYKEGLLQLIHNEAAIFVKPLSTFWPKPTLNINGFDVPYPESVAPARGTVYYFPFVGGTSFVSSYSWDGSPYDRETLSGGVLHLSKEAAEIHSRALRSFFKKD